MNLVWIALFAGIAAIGNALFAIGQREASGATNSLLFVGGSGLMACFACISLGSLWRPVSPIVLLQGHWKIMLLSGAGLFMTYLGFNLLYTRFGTSAYVVYAAMSVVTTTVAAGFLYLKEPMNQFHIAAVLFAAISIAFFSVGESRG